MKFLWRFQEEGKSTYLRIQEIMVEEAAFVVQFQPNYIMPAAASVKGAQPHGVYILQLRYASKEA